MKLKDIISSLKKGRNIEYSIIVVGYLFITTSILSQNPVFRTSEGNIEVTFGAPIPQQSNQTIVENAALPVTSAILLNQTPFSGATRCSIASFENVSRLIFSLTVKSVNGHKETQFFAGIPGFSNEKPGMIS